MRPSMGGHNPSAACNIYWRLGKSTAVKLGFEASLDARCMIDDHDTNSHARINCSELLVLKHLVKSEDPDQVHHPRPVFSHSHQ